MHFPENLQYSESHEWVSFSEDKTALVGLTDYAQHELGDLVFVTLPEEGDGVTAGDPFGEVESVKAVSEVLSPVTGVVLEINVALQDSPASINESPYEAWFVRVGEITGKVRLMNASEYEAFVEGK
ncbi:glycine cleavage system protein GcvH [Papillibacter cinnamivorans]|uniref:Glycine cleavage system H protein n=1 Tax=Papillibacter cinnamivorans DSM 12816 TaxID=1122930 RepID=A0A1W1ZMN1_9FIRM|nr:glycine cleavage system protein GcvH [Papillibacter cinnamivorans]SMC49666.1 glycine cleavage system H protein [Papillibacter cinnamivorans DSM 12816]